MDFMNKQLKKDDSVATCDLNFEKCKKNDSENVSLFVKIKYCEKSYVS